MWEALEHLSWVQAIGNSTWMYSTVAVTHYISMFWFIGSIAVVDLRIMGLAARDHSVRNLAQELFPWAWLGCALAVISGFLMFATDAGDWAPSPHFHIKLVLLGLAIVFAAIVQKSAAKWSEASDIPATAKLIALISLLLWIATVLSASEIPAKEGLG
jgi:Family of unknown function (DUF6644)